MDKQLPHLALHLTSPLLPESPVPLRLAAQCSSSDDYVPAGLLHYSHCEALEGGATAAATPQNTEKYHGEEGEEEDRA